MGHERSHRVEVALPLPVGHTFTYTVEGGMPAPGSRVLVPFRRERRVGWVVGPAVGDRTEGLKGIISVLDDDPSLPPDLLQLCGWISEYYLAPLGITLRAALPTLLTDFSRDYLVLQSTPSGTRTPRESRILDLIQEAGVSVRVDTLRKHLGGGSIWPEIRRLVAAGVLRHEVVPPREPSVKTRHIARVTRWVTNLAEREELFSRSPRQREALDVLEASGGLMEMANLLRQGGFSRSVVAGLEEKEVISVGAEEVVRDPFRDMPVEEPPELTPTADQAHALQTILEGIKDPKPLPFLLHGITGSGKTLVYIEVLREVVQRQGRSAIVLVPEISLTPQTVSRFRAHFGDDVAVLHSSLSDGERYDSWRQLRSGEKRIAVGARSAVFAPLEDLGVVVVDEEHDSSYKQSEAPRYHARDVAVIRARMCGALCVLGSATPSLESWRNAAIGKSVRLSLPERVAGGVLPPVRVVDLRTLRRDQEVDRGVGRGKDGGTVLSPTLAEGIRERIRRSEQVILLLNRRGYSSFVQCRECGYVETCPHCSISLTYHRIGKRILCHHCRHDEPAPQRCGRCGAKDLSFRGLGTEQVERVVAETFPEARLARMDVDTTSGKWAHHEILGRVERGEVDILLGTQMIAKGLDFPRVTLVGVVNADVGLHLPDFRASERTFQLLSQVAGRAGRGTLGGEVVIQTSVPDHYAVRAALTHDYEGFAARELKERESPAYPPGVRMVNAVLSSPAQELAARNAEVAVEWFRGHLAKERLRGVEVIGPAPSPIERLHGRWRWHFLARSTSAKSLGQAFSAFQADFRPKGGDVRVVIDRDPVALL